MGAKYIPLVHSCEDVQIHLITGRQAWTVIPTYHEDMLITTFETDKCQIIFQYIKKKKMHKKLQEFS